VTIRAQALALCARSHYRVVPHEQSFTMGAKTPQGGKTAGVSKVASARDADIAESFRRARGALVEVARDVKQLRGRAGALVKKTKPSR
jgi:hypothetical protein